MQCCFLSWFAEQLLWSISLPYIIMHLEPSHLPQWWVIKVSPGSISDVNNKFLQKDFKQITALQNYTSKKETVFFLISILFFISFHVFIYLVLNRLSTMFILKHVKLVLWNELILVKEDGTLHVVYHQLILFESLTQTRIPTLFKLFNLLMWNL